MRLLSGSTPRPPLEPAHLSSRRRQPRTPFQHTRRLAEAHQALRLSLSTRRAPTGAAVSLLLKSYSAASSEGTNQSSWTAADPTPPRTRSSIGAFQIRDAMVRDLKVDREPILDELYQHVLHARDADHIRMCFHAYGPHVLGECITAQ